MGETFEVSGSVQCTASVTGSAYAVWLEDSLLGLAEKLLSESQPSMAIVVAHVACETTVTRCLSRTLAARGADDLVEPVVNAMNGHTLVSARNRDLYRALTGDGTLTQQPFWKAYHESVEWRNHIVHNGRVYGDAEAEACLAAAHAFVTHLHAQMPLQAGA